MARKSEADKLLEVLGLAGLGGLVVATLKQPEIDRQNADIGRLQSQNAQLFKFYQGWEPLAKEFTRRKAKLEEYALNATVRALSGLVQEAYLEALRCYLLRRDLAASNMICLAVETLVRNAANDQQSHLAQVIDHLEAGGKLSPTDKRHLHILREIRNTQSHTVNTLDELTLLGLFKAVGDLARVLG